MIRLLAVVPRDRGELGGGAGSGGGAESPVRSDNLGGMLLDAEKQKASLQVGMVWCFAAVDTLFVDRMHTVVKQMCALSLGHRKVTCKRLNEAIHSRAVMPCSLQEQLDESRAEITQLQKQLMKAMKATAFAPLG